MSYSKRNKSGWFRHCVKQLYVRNNIKQSEGDSKYGEVDWGVKRHQMKMIKYLTLSEFQ